MSINVSALEKARTIIESEVEENDPVGDLKEALDSAMLGLDEAIILAAEGEELDGEPT